MRLWVDSNVARSTVRTKDLCRRAQSKGVEVVVHAQVYLEMRRQRRVLHGEAFDEHLFDGFLSQQKIRVLDIHLDQPTAAVLADELGRRYPTKEAWERAKQRTLGGSLKAGFEVEPGRMPMTTDWLIAFAAERDADARIITHDGGEEWRRLREAEPRRALSWEEALDWLSSLPAVVPPAGADV